VKTGRSGGGAGQTGGPVYVGHWILRFLLGRAARAVYEKRVDLFNRELTAYFDEDLRRLLLPLRKPSFP
jgi:hypothetical protein